MCSSFWKKPQHSYYWVVLEVRCLDLFTWWEAGILPLVPNRYCWLSPLSLWHYAVSYGYIQSSEILSLIFIWSYVCCLQLLFFTTWAPSITKQKDYVQNGLSNYYILRGSFIYLRTEILSHCHLLIITLNLFRLLLLVFLLGGSYQECWNASCQVCRFLLSKTASPGIEKVNLAGVAPFRDPTVPLSSSSCLHSGVLPWFLPVTYFASWIHAIYGAIKEAIWNLCKKRGFSLYEITPYLEVHSEELFINLQRAVLPRPKLSWHLRRIILKRYFDFIQHTRLKELWSGRKLFLLDTLYITLLYWQKTIDYT